MWRYQEVMIKCVKLLLEQSCLLNTFLQQNNSYSKVLLSFSHFTYLFQKCLRVRVFNFSISNNIFIKLWPILATDRFDWLDFSVKPQLAAITRNTKSSENTFNSVSQRLRLDVDLHLSRSCTCCSACTDPAPAGEQGCKISHRESCGASCFMSIHRTPNVTPMLNSFPWHQVISRVTYLQIGLIHLFPMFDGESSPNDCNYQRESLNKYSTSKGSLITCLGEQIDT